MKLNETGMDTDTLIIMGLTVTAFFWWILQRVQEDRRYAKDLFEEEKDKARRAERVKLLTNRR